MSDQSAKRRRLWRPFTTVLASLVLWQVLDVSGCVNPLFMPSPIAVAKSLTTHLSVGSTYRDLLATSMRAFVGLGISAVVAIPLGLLLGRFETLYEFVELPLDFIRSIPSSALYFLFILAFGVGNTSKVAVTVYGCLPVILVGAVYGARPNRERRDRIDMLRAFGASRVQVFFLAVLYDAIPQIAASLRVAVSLSLVLVIVTEMFMGSSDGLGRRLYDYYLAYRVDQMYAMLVLLGGLGFGANKVASAFEQRTGFWTHHDN